MYQNYNFGPLRFSPFAYLVLLVNFNQVNDDLAHASRPHWYMLIFYLILMPHQKSVELKIKKNKKKALAREMLQR